MVDGNNVGHSDLSAPGGNGDYRTSISYEEHLNKEKYGPVEERGFDIEISHPVESVEELIEKIHITAQFHEENKAQWQEKSSLANDRTELYDWAVLDIIDTVLASEGIDPAALTIPPDRLILVYLKKTRELGSFEALREYLADAPKTLVALGIDDLRDCCSERTLRNEETRLAEEIGGGIETLDDACVRAMFAAFRNGIRPPVAVNDRFGFDRYRAKVNENVAVNDQFGFDRYRAKVNEKDIDREDKQQALRNWIHRLLDETTQPLTFYRTDPRFEVESYLGLFASSALYNSGKQNVVNIDDYTYDRSSIPKGSGVGKYIDALPLHPDTSYKSDQDSIISQFDAVHAAFFEFASDVGFFSQSHSVAIDTYKIEWNGDDDAPTINRYVKAENDVRSEWMFLVASIIDTDARFTIGVRWARRKSKFPELATELLSQAENHFEIDSIYADAGLASGDMIETFRRFAGAEWVMRAPKSPEVKKFISLLPKTHIGYIPKYEFNCSSPPNLVAYPYKSTDPDVLTITSRQLAEAEPGEATPQQRSLDEFTNQPPRDSALPPFLSDLGDVDALDGIGDEETHAVLFTGRKLPERSAGGIHYPYYQRWAVEETINQLSNDVLPVSESSNPKQRLYSVNIAVLFQNWHTLINRASSPELLLRLDITHQEMLRAIQDCVLGQRQ